MLASDASIPPGLLTLITDTWTQNPLERPTAADVLQRLLALVSALRRRRRRSSSSNLYRQCQLQWGHQARPLRLPPLQRLNTLLLLPLHLRPSHIGRQCSVTREAAAVAVVLGIEAVYPCRPQPLRRAEARPPLYCNRRRKKLSLLTPTHPEGEMCPVVVLPSPLLQLRRAPPSDWKRR